jgi:hypothetical protein
VVPDGAGAVPAAPGPDSGLAEDTDGDGTIEFPAPEDASAAVTPLPAADSGWAKDEPLRDEVGLVDVPEPPEAGEGPAVGVERGALVDAAAGIDLAAYDEGEEVLGLRTAESRTFAGKDGQLRTELSTAPMFVEDDSGKFVAPDNHPEQGADDRWRPAVGRDEVSFAAKASDAELVRMGFPGDRLAVWGLAGAAPSEGIRSADALRYGEVFAGVDLKLEATPSGVKETIVVTDPGAPTTFEFNLTLRGLEAKLEDPFGSIELVDAASGEPVATIPSAWALDARRGSAGERPEPTPVAYELREQGAATTLVLRLDEDWLRDPARMFPVEIDPTTIDHGVGGDAWTLSSAPTQNYGADTVLRMGGQCSPSPTNCQSYDRRNVFVKWELGLLSSAAILEAKYYSWNMYSTNCAPATFQVYEADGLWDEGTINWNNQPIPTPTPLGEYNQSHGNEGAGCADAWVDPPTGLTRLTQEWVDGQKSNDGIAVRVAYSDTYTGVETYKHFASQEYVGSGLPNGGQILKITWTPYRASYQYLSNDGELSNNTGGEFKVKVTNKHVSKVWTANNPTRYFLSYHVSGDATIWNGHFTSVGTDMGYGSRTITAGVDPLPPGSYLLSWEMVELDGTGTGIGWFSQEGAGLHPDLTPYVLQVNVANRPPYIEQMSPSGNVHTLTPSLNAKGQNPDGWPSGALQYSFKVCTNSAMTAGCQTSGWQSSQNWVPANLKWATKYYWQPSVRETGDAAVLTRTAPVASLLTEVKQPALGKHFGTGPYSSLHNGVNPAVGNYMSTFVDAQVAAVGLPLEVERTYNSMDTRVGSFGPGWMSFLDVSAQREADGKVLITYPDGRQERHAPNPDGTYGTGLGIPSVLSEDPGGNLFLTRPDKTIYRFDPQGRVNGIFSPADDVVTIARDTAGTVDYVRNESSQRTLHFAWAPSGPGGEDVVTRVATDPVTVEGQQRTPEWTYSYDGSGHLAGSCAPQAAPNCRSYTYFASGTGAAGKLQRVVEPEGNDAVELHYATDGSVDWVENGTNDRWAYDDADDQAEGTYHPLNAWRAAAMTVAANATVTVDVTGGGGVPDAGVQAVVVDVASAEPAASGWFALYPSGTSEPAGVSTMDYHAGDSRSTLHTVAVGADGKVKLANHGGAVTTNFTSWVGTGRRAWPVAASMYRSAPSVSSILGRRGRARRSVPVPRGLSRSPE